MRQIQYTDGVLNFTIEKNFYTKEVIYKCFYWYLDEYEFDMTSSNETYNIKLTLKVIKKIDEEDLIFRIKNDLADFQLREIIAYETNNVKDLIIAKALSNYEEEFELSSDVSDPIGFDPKII